MVENTTLSFSKKDSVEITSMSWVDGIVEKPENIISGFKCGGIWPLDLSVMKKRWRIYHEGGVNNKKTVIQPWITCRDSVRTNILNFPDPVDKKPRKRNTLDMNDRLLTRDQINMYEE